MYYQIARELERLIENGTLQPGERLPGDTYLSRVLKINYRTLEKVLEHLQEKGLVTKKGRHTFISENIKKAIPNIGFFYLTEAEYYMAKRGEFMHGKFSQAGYDLKIIPYQNRNYFEEVNLIEEIRKRDLAGAVIVPTNTLACKKSLLALEKEKIPYVRLGRSFFSGELKAPLVRGNDKKSVMVLLDYLWKIGHRKIGLITGEHGDENEQAYKDFYRDKKISPEERWCLGIGFTGPIEQWNSITGEFIAKGYLEKNPDVTAIIATLPIAWDFMKVAFLCGRNVPEHLSVVALSYRPEWITIKPALTAVELSDKKMGETAAQLLLEVIETGFPDKEKIIFVDYDLVERESVAPPAIKMDGVSGS
ncbi:MAG: LacI family transcriptional regulator [bacterium]|nr:LacI family transcriptional regulator [bacterium]